MLRVVRHDDRRAWGILAGRFSRRVDPNRGRQGFGPGRSVHEPLGMGGVSRQARAITALEDRRRPAVVHVSRYQVAKPTMVMRIVVPRKEIVADGARMCERAEPIRKLGSVLQSPKLRFRKRIVIAHARPRVTGVDPEVREEQRDQCAPHGGPPVRVNRQLLRLDPLLRTGLLEQAFGQAGALAGRDIQPTT